VCQIKFGLLVTDPDIPVADDFVIQLEHLHPVGFELRVTTPPDNRLGVDLPLVTVRAPVAGHDRFGVALTQWAQHPDAIVLTRRSIRQRPAGPRPFGPGPR
jgi:hypothetical protein